MDPLIEAGCPFASNSTSVQLRNNSGGGLSLLQDTQLIETLAHFSRERIPERYASPQYTHSKLYLSGIATNMFLVWSMPKQRGK